MDKDKSWTTLDSSPIIPYEYMATQAKMADKNGQDEATLALASLTL